MLYKFYGLSILSAVIAFSVISAAMIALGGTQPPHPALRGFIEGCEGVPQPCWYGIVPGVTTFEEAQVLLPEAGYSFVHETSRTFWIMPNDEDCSVHFGRDEIISAISLSHCPTQRVEDLIQVLGEPTTLSYGCTDIITGRYKIFFEYDRGILFSTDGILDRQSLINWILLESNSSDSTSEYSVSWEGFRLERYYQRRGMIHQQCMGFALF